MDSQEANSFNDNLSEIINPLAVLHALKDLFLQTFPDLKFSTISIKVSESLVAEKLFQAYSDILTDFAFEDDEILNVSEIQIEPSCQISEEESQEQSQESWKITTSQESQSNLNVSNTTVSMDRKKEIVTLWKNHPKWKLNTLRKKGGAKEVKSLSTLYYWKKQIERGPSVHEKYAMIDAHVIHEIMQARKSFKIIRSSHLKYWGLQKYLEFQDQSFKFKACTAWVTKVKKRHKIRSRKITRLVSRRELKSADQITADDHDFQDQMKMLIPSYPPHLVFNTDQCGFAYELLSQRTLTKQGEKTVFGFAQSPTNLATHSYTVQYIINAAGHVFQKVYLCLQEKNGKLGPRVKADIESTCPSNIFLTCSTSGKLSTSLTEYFLRKLVAENVKEDFMWIVDSWPGHTNIRLYDSIFGKEHDTPECNLKIIPEKCTPICQPLDTTFHRQLKILAREVLSALEVLNCEATLHPEDNWTNRKGIIKLQSLLHHQISAPIFIPMIKYSWYSSGLIAEKPTFKNVNEVCFSFGKNESLICESMDCDSQRFIKCARCMKRLCLHHFWFENHFNFCEKNTFI